MRILMLAPCCPFPANHGLAIRVYNLAKAIGLQHELGLVFPTSGGHVPSSQISFLREVIPVPAMSDGSIVYRVAKHVRCLQGITPPEFVAPWDAVFAERVRQLARSGRYDVIHVDHLSMARFGLSQTELPVVFTAHNVESALRRRMLDLEPRSAQKLYAELKAKQLVAYEKEVVARAAVVITVSEEDARAFQNWGRTEHICVVPNGVDTEFFVPHIERKSGEPPTLVYTGLMSYRPNVDAAVFMVNRILPLIRERIPNVKLFIVGRNPTPEVTRLGSDCVTVTGEVPDIRPFLQRADVFCVPLRSGGGTRLKILEAMAAGIPLVSTGVGIEGIKATPAEHYLLADQPEEFASAVVSLLRNRSSAKHLADAARKLVTERYSWSAIAAQFEGALEQGRWLGGRGH